jgi:outer membrane protein OmpA-like peptidoglycan-associated protein
MLGLMRRICVLVCLLVAGPAYAGPISISIQGHVAIGHKPVLKVRALQTVTHLQVDLVASRGPRVKARRAALAKGQTVAFPLGNGAAGRVDYEGTLSMTTASGKRWTRKLTFKTLVSAPLHVRYSYDHLDLEHHVLEFSPSRPVASAELVVIGDDGHKLGTGSAHYDSGSAGTWLSIRWTQPPDTRVMKMQLRVVGRDGGATRVNLTPWSVTIRHEDVVFPTGSAVIEPSEHDKLEASCVRIVKTIKRSGRFLKMKLYVAGHTDTVGSAADNRTLSAARARAIARYFRKHGVSIPIAFAGFGEQVLEVQTPDNTDEPRNRRADYVLGPANGAPPFKGRYRKARVRWHALP